jgi:hypothetical protein
MRRDGVRGQYLLKPALEKIVHARRSISETYLQCRTDAFSRTGMFWQPFEAVKAVESRLGMGQPSGPIGDAIAVSHSELEVQNLSVRHIF